MEMRNGSRVNRLNKDSFKIYLIFILTLNSNFKFILKEKYEL